MASGRGQAVQEGAVIAEQQRAGSVLVEPTDALRPAPRQMRRQQGVHAGVITRRA